MTGHCRLPAGGQPPLAAVGELDATIAADTIRKLDRLTADGWAAQEAFESYRQWWLRCVGAALDEGLCEWIWRRAA